MAPGMRRAWQVAAALMLALCLFVAQQSLQLSLTDRLGPGPGFFPFWLSAIGAVLAAALLLRASLQPADTQAETTRIVPTGQSGRGILAILTALAATAALMNVLGFRLTMLLFVTGLVVMLGERRWWAALLFGLAGSFGVHHIFNDWLDVILPVGILGF